MQPAIPPYDGIKTYQQVPFQYSLHIIEKEGDELLHKELLVFQERILDELWQNNYVNFARLLLP